LQSALANAQSLPSGVAANLPPGAQVVVSSVIPQGFAPGQCECAFLTFGYWSSTITYTGTYRNGQTDTILNAPYVAGTVGSQPVALPNTQSATYSGFMYGNVLNNGSLYNAGGSMNVVWNYASRAGGVTANFDGMNLSGAVAAVGNTANVQGSIQSVTGGVSGPLTGSFFAGGGDPSKYLAGSFGLKGTNYTAGGIFATQR
jgi:hypothetical protein